MSINLHIEAERPVADDKGNILTQNIEFDVWQTPTNITRDILNSENPIQAYKDWILSFNPSSLHHLAHIKQLDFWLEQKKQDGYTLDICGW